MCVRKRQNEREGEREREREREREFANLYFDLSSIVVDGDGLDGTRAVGGGALGLEVVLVRSRHPFGLEPPPAGGVVGNGAAVRALERHMTFVVCGKVYREEVSFHTLVKD